MRHSDQLFPLEAFAQVQAGTVTGVEQEGGYIEYEFEVFSFLLRSEERQQ